MSFPGGMPSVDPWVNTGADVAPQGEPSFTGGADEEFIDPNAPMQLSVAQFANMANSFSRMEQTLADQQRVMQQLAEQVSVLRMAPDPIVVPPPPSTPKPAPAPEPPVAPVTPANPSAKPNFNPPPVFKGKASEVDAFLDAVEDAVELQASALPTDRSKCIYLAGFLGETGKLWYRALKKGDPEYLDNWTKFRKAFRSHFGDHNLAYNSALKLKELKQTQSTAQYAARFGELLIHVDWSDATAIDQFYEGLKSSTKDMISQTSRSERPTSLGKYIRFAIDCDNRVHERELERKRETKQPNGKNGNGNGTSHASHSNSSSIPSYSPPASTSSSPATSLPMGEPMEIDAIKTRPRGPLSDAEKARHKTLGLCMWCGKCGKDAENCPNRSPDVVKRMAAQKAAREAAKKKASPSGKA